MISIHSLREEGDPRRDKRSPRRIRFQSTPSVRRETVGGVITLPPTLISIHSLREEGDFTKIIFDGMDKISIHSLREEGDYA